MVHIILYYNESVVFCISIDITQMHMYIQWSKQHDIQCTLCFALLTVSKILYGLILN